MGRTPLPVQALKFLVAVVGRMRASPAETARADRRQVKQQARIVEGVKSDELTQAEAVRLQAQQVALKREKRQARADDGKLALKCRGSFRYPTPPGAGQAARHAER